MYRKIRKNVFNYWSHYVYTLWGFIQNAKASRSGTTKQVDDTQMITYNK